MIKFEVMTAEQINNLADNDYPTQSQGANRCECGRFKSPNSRCSLEIPVYRGGTYAGWEHR